LRELIVSSGEPLVEVSPVPEGYRFIACLTHDIDHPSIRWHGLDHTTIGFLYRAIFGSVQQGLQGRTSMHSVMKNWKAAAKLALIHLGLADDFWESFDHNYAAIEKGLPSSFFAIPFKGQEGRTRTGRAPKRRAARYGITDIRGQLEALATVGHEIGLHGIDAWLDSSSADRELHEVRALAPSDQLGVRMHWLYFDEHSPAVLDAAGADYDSTVGYNDTIGFRAGTTQVFKPFSAKNLLELPLDVMDTALFYPTYLNLSREEARAAVSRIIDAAIRFGGVITLNWHDRSLAPERLWGDVYAEIIDELREKGAWFATAGQAVSWFRMRRKATFETSRGTTAIVQGHLTQADKILPRLRVQLHNAPRLAVAH
jgi:peptidoglycan/xylan/chitin deacetylase (PgdA/CDA1 family)